MSKTFTQSDELAWMVICPPSDVCDYRVYFTRMDAEVADEMFRDECLTEEDDAERRTQGVTGLVSIDEANARIAELEKDIALLRAECKAWRSHTQEIAHLSHSKECDIGPDPDCEICQSAIKHGIMPARAATDAANALEGE